MQSKIVVGKDVFVGDLTVAQENGLRLVIVRRIGDKYPTLVLSKTDGRD